MSIESKLAFNRLCAEERNAIIDECVRVARDWLLGAEQGSGEDLLDAIQALKHTP